jgi:hypothetical protein
MARATGTKRTEPMPAHRLLAALIRAMEAGVDNQEILMAMRFADRAEGVKQSPVWGMVTDDMNAAADKMNALQDPT